MIPEQLSTVSYRFVKHLRRPSHKRAVGNTTTADSTCEQRLRRSDIYLRRYFYVLAKRFGHQPSLVVVPEDFFWRKMAQVPIVQVDAE